MTARRLDKVLYYAANLARDASPQFLFRRRLDAILATTDLYDPAYLATRVNYCNKLSMGARVAIAGSAISRISMDNSFYYYDLKEHARYFPRALRLEYRFGDVTGVPATPTVVKSRPVAGDVSNSVLMKLNKLRHFYLVPDVRPFAEKKPLAVWRGNVKLGAKRLALVRRWHGHPLCDIGHAGGRNAPEHDGFRSPFLTPAEQMAFKYVVSVEGNDVATNLKWLMATNSLCLMAPPVYETWFMEGRLEAGKHYVRLRPDFADLEKKIHYYERHPDEALEIIRNAQAHVRQFQDDKCEQLISLLVLYKYFVVTGQIEPDRRLEPLFRA